jgi:protein-disulfide isomerase
MKISLALVLGLATAAVPATARQQPGPQVMVAGAVPDASGETLTITGGNFRNRPFVTLDLVPLTVQFATDGQIIAVAPVRLMPPGKYLLTVSCGPSASDSASLQITLGEPKPEAPRPAGGVPVGPSFPPPLASTPSSSGGRAEALAQAGSSGVGQAPWSAAGDEPAAKVGDRVITVAEVDRELGRTDPGAYVGLGRRLFDLRRRVADKMVADELLAREAAARGLTTEALLEQEIPTRVVAMPESAVISLYEGLGDNTRGATLEQMRPALRAWLERVTEPELARMTYVEELMKVSTRAEIFLVPPRVQVERAAQDASLGPATAAIEIVAFGDFQSTHYARFAQAFGKVRETFGDRIRLVFKNLPVLGPDSIAAAEAAQCAHAQGRFWPYHDALVAQPGLLLASRLKQSASDVGLNRGAFDACVDRGEFRGVIRDALDEAARYDLRSSPSFLVNGRLAPEPPAFLPPFEFFTRVIEEELLMQSKGR